MLVACPHCGSTVSANQHIVRRAKFSEALERARAANVAHIDLAPEHYIRVGAHSIRRLATLARADHASVYLGASTGPCAMRFTIKVANAPLDESAHANAISTLTALQKSPVNTVPFYSTRLPQIVASGIDRAQHEDQPRAVLLLRHPAEYWGSLDRVLAHHAGHTQGIDARHVAWMASRALDLIDFVHASGYVHGAPTLDHWLVQPRDHALMLIGWSQSFAPHPGEFVGERTHDLRQLAWSLRRLLSEHAANDAHTPPAMRIDVPTPLRDFFSRCTEDTSWLATQTGRSLFSALGDAVTAAFGPRRYVHFDPRAAAPGSAH